MAFSTWVDEHDGLDAVTDTGKNPSRSADFRPC